MVFKLERQSIKPEKSKVGMNSLGLEIRRNSLKQGNKVLLQLFFRRNWDSKKKI